jgi:hypothetical protein
MVKGNKMKNDFEKNGYVVVKNFIPKDLCNFTKAYFRIQQDALNYVIDPQCPLSKSFYGDPLCETILLTGTKKLSEVTGRNLAPTYSYTRIYAQGDELVIHRDRAECEISATLCLGRPSDQEISPIYFSKNEDGSGAVEMFLEEGDLCIYKGPELYHWRKPFEQTWYLQTFLHYIDLNGPYRNRIYDGRRSLGIKK